MEQVFTKEWLRIYRPGFRIRFRLIIATGNNPNGNFSFNRHCSSSQCRYCNASDCAAQAGIPEAGLALIFAVDRPLDMCRTIVNVTGDAAVSSIVNKSLGNK